MTPEEVPQGSSPHRVVQSSTEGGEELPDKDSSGSFPQQGDAAAVDNPEPLTTSQDLAEASGDPPSVYLKTAEASGGEGQDGLEEQPKDANMGNDEEGDARLEGNDQEKYSSGDIRIHIASGLDGIMGVLVRKQNLKRMGLLEGEDSACVLSPFKSFSKRAILQEITKKGKDSDWAEHKAIIKAYPLEDVLLVRDEAGSYGANYLMPFTEIAFKAVHEAITTASAEASAARGEAESKKRQDLEMEAKKRLRDENADIPLTPRDWQSETADMTANEIEGMTIKAKRPLLKQTFLKRAEELGCIASYQPFADRVLSLKTLKDTLSVDIKQELDFGVQAVPSMRDAWSQAAGDAMNSVEIQHDSNSLTKGPGLPSAVSRKSFQAFFSKVASTIEEALQQNETVDILKDDLSQMETTVSASVQEPEEGLKEVFTFTDLSYSKNKLISFIRWIPESEKLIACAAMDAATFDERVEAPARSSKSVILIWSLENPLVPQQLFAAPSEVTTFCFVPASQNRLYLVAGLLTGQIVVWEASSLKMQQATSDSTHSTKLQPVVVSSAIDFSHKRPVQHLVPLPPKLDFRRSLAIYFNSQAENAFFLSCGADGGVHVWDITAAVASADNNEFLWRPLLQCHLRKQDPGGPVGCCHLIVLPTLPQTVSSEFWAATEEGDVLLGDWGVSFDDGKSDHIKQHFHATRCFRPSRDFQLSPFIPRIALLVTDFAFHILRLGCPRPVYSSPTPPASYSCGVWSPSRPGVLFLGRTDGNLEVWDLRDQLQKPTTISAVSAVQLTSLAFPQLQQQQVPPTHQHTPSNVRKSRKLTRQPPLGEAMATSNERSPSLAYLAAGDATGALRVLKLFPSLTNPNTDELSHISSMLLKDDGRVEYLNEREAVLKKAAEEKNKRQTAERGSEEVEAPPEGETESLELQAMEAEYRAMEAAFLKELQQRATQENTAANPA